MRAFCSHTGIVIPLDRANVDTDQIIPKQFLKRIERSGYGKFLFHDWRFREDGQPDPQFVLNSPWYEGASILVAGRNFGCGSSREHAAWALADYGIRAVLAPSFADIFANNALKNGIPAITLPEFAIQELQRRATAAAGYHLTVDLEQMAVCDTRGMLIPFTMDDFRRRCLLEGLDDIALTLQHESVIATFESRRAQRGY